MEELLSKLYEKVICTEDVCIELQRKFDAKVTEMLKPLYQTMEKEQVESIRELICSAACLAEKNGFYLGVHTAVKLMSEAVSISDVEP